MKLTLGWATAGELELESWSWLVPIEGAVIQVFDLRVMSRLFIEHTVTTNTE